MAQTPMVAKWLSYLYPVCQCLLQMQVLLGSVEYADLPNAHVSIPVADRMANSKGMKKIPIDAWCTDGSSWGNSPTWTTVAIQPNTDIIWMETGMNCSSQWLKLRAFCFVITHVTWLLTCCTHSGAVLKRLTL